MKGYTDFIGGMFEYHPEHHDGVRYMDWDKVKQICLANPTSKIEAGLREDWNNTSGIIFNNGEYYDGGTLYNQSRWATPIVDIDDVEIEVWTNEPLDFSGIPNWWGNGSDLKCGWQWEWFED